MDKLRIRLVRKVDANNREYFYTTCNVPITIDLSKTVLHVYPGQDEESGAFYAELVVRHYDRVKTSNEARDKRRSRTNIDM